MKTTLLLALASILVCAGCARTKELTTSKVRIQIGTNLIEITQPKDTVFKKLIADPIKGTLTIEGYASSANVHAIESAATQAESQAMMFSQSLEFLRTTRDTMARAYGVPTNPNDPAITYQAPPSGMKWRISTNRIPELAPKDDHAGGVTYNLN